MTPEERKLAAAQMRHEIAEDRASRPKKAAPAPKAMTYSTPSVQRSTMANRQGNGPVGTPVGGAAGRAADAMKNQNAKNEAAMKEAAKYLH